MNLNLAAVNLCSICRQVFRDGMCSLFSRIYFHTTTVLLDLATNHTKQKLTISAVSGLCLRRDEKKSFSSRLICNKNNNMVVYLSTLEDLPCGLLHVRFTVSCRSNTTEIWCIQSRLLLPYTRWVVTE